VNQLEFIDAVADRANATPDRAEILARATLETLADRLSGGEAQDLAEELPKPLQGPLRRPIDKPAERFGLDEFVRRAAERAGVDAAQAKEGVRAVLTTVREAVSGGEFRDVMSQFPKEFREVIESTSWQGGAPPGRR
jgi:uncharacterized protein (DUF2267 family)